MTGSRASDWLGLRSRLRAGRVAMVAVGAIAGLGMMAGARRAEAQQAPAAVDPYAQYPYAQQPQPDVQQPGVQQPAQPAAQPGYEPIPQCTTTTTTTTTCTGTAAPYAVPGNQQPVQPQPQVAPVMPPPQWMPQQNMAPGMPVYAQRTTVTRERRWGMFITGGAMFLSSYGLAAMYSVGASDGSVEQALAYPLIGPFMAARRAAEPSCEYDYHYDCRSGSSGITGLQQAGMVIDGLAQWAGLAMAIAGPLSFTETKVTKNVRVAFGPGPGVGVGATGRF